MSITKTIKINTLYNLSSKIVQVVMALWLIPFTLLMIGTEKYGIWAVIQVTTTLLGCLDLGINGAYIKFFSEQHKDSDELSKILSTGIAYHVILCASVILVLFFCPVTALFTGFFNLPPSCFKEVDFAFKCNAIFFFIANIFQVFHHFLVASGRQDITNKILIISSVLNALVTVMVLKLGLGLYGLSFAFALIQVVNGGLFYIFFRRLNPALNITVLRFSRRTFKNMFLFGKNIQVCHIADLITLYTDRIFVGLFFTVELTGLHHVGATLINRLRETPNLFLSAMLPEACRIASEGDSGKLLELYKESLRRLITVIAPLFFFTAASSPLLIFVWMGWGFEKIAYVTGILAIGSLLGVLSGTGCVIGQAISRPEIQMKTGVLTALSNILLSIFLAMKIGFLGISAATAGASLLGFLYFFRNLNRELKISSFPVIKAVLSPILFSFVLAAALFSANLLFVTPEFISGRISGGILLVFEFSLFITLYLLLLTVFNNYTAYGELPGKKRVFKKGVS